MPILEDYCITIPFADITSLKAFDLTGKQNGLLSYVINEGVFAYDQISSAVADDLNIIQPDVGVGRWFRNTMSTFAINLEGKIDPSILPFDNPLQFKGSISVPADFPTLAEVQNGWFYIINADVTDNDPTKTNTGQSFLEGDEIAWNGTNWSSIGKSELWFDDGENLNTVNKRGIIVPKDIVSYADVSSITFTLGNAIAYSHWNLNGNAIDISGNSYNGNPENITWISGKLNEAAQFNGIDSNIDIGNIANFERTEKFSIECWVNADGTNLLPSVIIAKQDSSLPEKGYLIRYDPSATLLDVALVSEALINELHLNYLINLNDSWNHLVVTYDGLSEIDSIKVYVNNTLLSSVFSLNTLSSSIVEPNTPLLIGCRGGYLGAKSEFWLGSIDEMVIYSFELSEYQIAKRWNNGTGTENLASGNTVNYIDLDPDLSANSDSRLVSQKAVKDYFDKNTSKPEVDQFISTSGQTLFTLSQTPIYPTKGILTINGQEQSYTSYNVSGTTLTLVSTVSLIVGDKVNYYYAYGGSGGGAVSSVFTRTGDIVAVSGDYDASQVDNDSGVSGSYVSDALDTLNSGKEPTLTKGNLVGTTNQINVSGGTGAIIGAGATLSLPSGFYIKEHHNQPNYDSNYGNWKVETVAAAGIARLPIDVPSDARIINNVYVEFFVSTGAAGSGKDIDLTSEYCEVGQLFNQYTQSDTTSTYDFTGFTDRLYQLDVTSLFTNLAGGMQGTLFFDTKGIGGAVYIVGTIVKYTI